MNYEQILEKSQEILITYGPNIIAALVILILGRLAAGLLSSLLGRIMTKSKVDATLISFIQSVTFVGMMAFVVVAALGKLGVATASFVAILGAAGLAVGLALQGSLANFASGVLMIIFKPFKVGDFIEGAGTAGVVEEIGIFTTVLKTPDNKKIIIPNAKVTGDNVTNFSANPNRRVDIVAGVSYSDNLDKVKKVLQSILDSDERVLKDPAPKIAVSELADSSVNFVVRPWVKTEDYWDVYFSIQESIKKRFDEEEISIPFPQRDVHLFKSE